LGPLNIFYGPTASGKSTLMYSVLALKGFLANPNRPSDAFFNLGFIDLGGFDATVYNHQATSAAVLGIEIAQKTKALPYQVEIKKAAVTIRLESTGLSLKLDAALPEALNQSVPAILKVEEEEYNVNWNGVAATVSPQKRAISSNMQAAEIT